MLPRVATVLPLVPLAPQAQRFVSQGQKVGLQTQQLQAQLQAKANPRDAVSAVQRQAYIAQQRALDAQIVNFPMRKNDIIANIRRSNAAAEVRTPATKLAKIIKMKRGEDTATGKEVRALLDSADDLLTKIKSSREAFEASGFKVDPLPVRSPSPGPSTIQVDAQLLQSIAKRASVLLGIPASEFLTYLFREHADRKPVVRETSGATPTRRQ
jgi:hypothetical protein